MRHDTEEESCPFSTLELFHARRHVQKTIAVGSRMETCSDESDKRARLSLGAENEVVSTGGFI